VPNDLPTIKSVGGWTVWKQLPATEWAFRHLDEPIDPSNESQTYIVAILKKVFPDGFPSNNSIAFTMAVSTVFLDPNSGTVDIHKRIIMPKMMIYLVSSILMIFI